MSMVVPRCFEKRSIPENGNFYFYIRQLPLGSTVGQNVKMLVFLLAKQPMTTKSIVLVKDCLR